MLQWGLLHDVNTAENDMILTSVVTCIECVFVFKKTTNSFLTGECTITNPKISNINMHIFFLNSKQLLVLLRLIPLHLPSSPAPSVIWMFLFMSPCLSSIDKLANQLEVSVWRIISLFPIKIAGLQILPFHFAACLLPSTFHNSSVTPAIFHVPPSNNRTSLPLAFEGVNQTGELNAFLMSRRQSESGDAAD